MFLVQDLYCWCLGSEESHVVLGWGTGGKSLVLLNAWLETFQKRRGREQAVFQISYKIHIFKSILNTLFYCFFQVFCLLSAPNLMFSQNILP